MGAWKERGTERVAGTEKGDLRDGGKVGQMSRSPCLRAWVGVGTRQGFEGEETNERVDLGW